MSAAETQDRIERDIHIAAPISTVWGLISEPGWWINDGELVPHRIEPAGPDRVVVHDPVHGAFTILTVAQRAGEYAAFRWESGADADHAAATPASTLVEFFLTELPDAATHLRVVESGFADLPVSDQERRAAIAANTEGWEQELAAAGRVAEATHTGGRAARDVSRAPSGYGQHGQPDPRPAP